MNDFLAESNNKNLFEVSEKDNEQNDNDSIINKSKLLNANLDDECDQTLYKCDHCPRVCKRKGDFQKHARTHTGEKPFKCNDCDKSYATQTSLKIHERSLHTGERPYKCDYCEKAFTNLTNYKNHVRIHTGEKPYTCNLCSRAFTEHSTLYKHQLTHSKEKKYSCNQCGNSYRQLSSLKSHTRAFHSTENAKNFAEANITSNEEGEEEVGEEHLQEPLINSHDDDDNNATASNTNCCSTSKTIVKVLNDKRIKIINKKKRIENDAKSCRLNGEVQGASAQSYLNNNDNNPGLVLHEQQQLTDNEFLNLPREIPSNDSFLTDFM